MFGDIKVKCRPLRLAFLIPPEKAALRKAIQINSTLWGGTYNPIIPLYAQPPKTWKDYPRQKIAMKDRIVGYVRAFDPDILVDCTGSKLPSYLVDLGRETISVDEIWSNFFSDQRDGAPKYGVGIFELLNGIFKEYFDVVRRFPSKVAFPIFPKEYGLFWAAIHLVKWKRNTRWKPPLAEDVFFAWLKDKAFDAELSTCGRLAKQMYSQLGGWLSVLTNEPLLSLLDTMTRGGEDGKGAPLGEVKNRVNNIGSRDGGMYQSLVERKVFQLGYKTQCKHCGRASWFSVDDLAAELTCPLCYRNLDAINAVDNANKGAWHLKTAGPFSVEKFADGSYSVLLALHFLQQGRSLQTTPVMSFKAKHASTQMELEADLGVMWQEMVSGESQDGVLFAECKSYNEFERKDFERMKELAKQFPGAILAFCTLRKTLAPREVKEIKKIAKTGTKRWKTERPINPVLVLTGHELFSVFGAPRCWKGMTIPGWADRPQTLLGTCNATQAIHLGMAHWQDVWSAEVEKKLKRRGDRKSGGG
jgi:hypothetical protein